MCVILIFLTQPIARPGVVLTHIDLLREVSTPDDVCQRPPRGPAAWHKLVRLDIYC